MTKIERIYIALSLLILVVSCKSREEKEADSLYQDFKTMIALDSFAEVAKFSADYIAQFHYDENKRAEARSWLQEFKRREESRRQIAEAERNELQNRFDKIGGYKLLSIDTKTKCNLTKGYYVLNVISSSESDLSWLAKYLANALFIKSVKDPECSYPIMSQAFVYQSEIDYIIDKGEYVSMCSITPQNYSGDVYVNSHKLKSNGKGK